MEGTADRNGVDTMRVSLHVAAVLMDTDIWMQGNLEIRINGEKPYAESDVVDAELFIKSINVDGEYFIFSCCCGVPGCSGWESGIRVEHLGPYMQWTNLNNGMVWKVDRETVREEVRTIRQEVSLYKHFFADRNIEYTGVGYAW